MTREVLHRREDRAPDADADPGVAAPEPEPLGVALRAGEAGVQERHVVAEARAEAAGELRRERDLGDEHERALARGARARDGPEVDLGLARAGDAVEEEGREGAERALRSRRARLACAGRERGRPPSRPRRGARRARPGVSVSSRTSPRLREGGERGAAAREGGAQLLDRDAAAGEEVLEDGALGAGARARPASASAAAGLRGRVLDAAARRRLGRRPAC